MRKFSQISLVCFTFLILFAFSNNKTNSQLNGFLSHQVSSNYVVDLHEADIEITDPEHLSSITSNKVVIKWTAWADSGVLSFTLKVLFMGPDDSGFSTMFEEVGIDSGKRKATLTGIPNGFYEVQITLKTNSDGDRQAGVNFAVHANENVSNPQIKGLSLGSAIPLIVLLCYCFFRIRKRRKVNY